MAQSVAGASQQAGVHDHGFHTLRVSRVVTETADACSLVLDVPEDLRDAFAYRAGQFCTFRVWVDGEPLLRCYSMCSAPTADPDLRVTIKRVPDGVVSNWVNDSVAEGDDIEATLPAGVFQLTEADGELLAFAAGSGITPVISLVKEALATTARRVRLLYANRDVESTIFRAELEDLIDRHADRLDVVHHLDVDHGFVDGAAVDRFMGTSSAADVAADVYVCGPGPFMDIVEAAVLGGGIDRSRLHIERFTPADPVGGTDGTAGAADHTAGAADHTHGDDDSTAGGAEAPDEDVVTRVTIELDGRTETADHRAGTTILQVARQLGMKPPSSCESGSCATCMARLVEGTVSMKVNNALEDDEVEEGWVLTCQSVPTSDAVHVVYGYD